MKAEPFPAHQAREEKKARRVMKLASLDGF